MCLPSFVRREVLAGGGGGAWLLFHGPVRWCSGGGGGPGCFQGLLLLCVGGAIMYPPDHQAAGVFAMQHPHNTHHCCVTRLWPG